MSPPRIVVIDDHPAVCQALTTFLAADGYELICHPRAADAVPVICTVQPAVALIDLHLEYPQAGLRWSARCVPTPLPGSCRSSSGRPIWTWRATWLRCRYRR